MEQRCKQALTQTDPEAKIALLEQACSLYRGEFLPAMSGEAWVEVYRGMFQDLYLQSVRKLCALLKEAGAYEKVRSLCHEAMALYPLEEWAEIEIQCLITQKRYREAMQACHEAVSELYIKQGLRPSEKLSEQFEIISRRMNSVSMNLLEIKENLREAVSEDGPLCCTYQGFLDCFRVKIRGAERNHQTGMLLVCTLCDRKQQPLTDEAKLSDLLKRLEHVLRISLRKGDIYTRYNNSQILILASGLKAANVPKIEGRLLSGFEGAGGSKKMLQIQSIPLEQWLEQ